MDKHKQQNKQTNLLHYDPSAFQKHHKGNTNHKWVERKYATKYTTQSNICANMLKTHEKLQKTQNQKLERQ